MGGDVIFSIKMGERGLAKMGNSVKRGNARFFYSLEKKADISYTKKLY